MLFLNSIIVPPIMTSINKLKKLYTSQNISFFTKCRILTKQVVFLNFLIVANILWLLDEFFFSDYKTIQIKRPLFLLGGFRTGTTIIHRSLYKKNDNFISPRFLELLFPFIMIQYFLDFLEYCDDNYKMGIIPMIDYCIYNFFGEKIMKKHFISFYNPEEDDILLSTYMGLGWYNIVQFPLFETWTNTGRFILSDTEKEKIGIFYHKCMQKILYRRGKNKRLLNKSHLISMYPIWKKQYPDSKYVCIERDPVDSFSSWISLNKYTNERFFKFQYTNEEYIKNHTNYWNQFEFDKNKIIFDSKVKLEDFCNDKHKVLNTILEDIKDE